MAVEIERKFLVDSSQLPPLPEGRSMKQGYIRTGTLNSVRIRIHDTGAFLTIKGPSGADGLSRSEFEYEIPVEDAGDIFDGICDGGTVEKIRYEVPFGGLIWEVDVFTGASEGLVMAEVELPDETVVPEIPAWAVREVTGDPRYYNMRLAVNPRPFDKD